MRHVQIKDGFGHERAEEMAKAISYVIQLAHELADTLLKVYEMATATLDLLRS